MGTIPALRRTIANKCLYKIPAELLFSLWRIPNRIGMIGSVLPLVKLFGYPENRRHIQRRRVSL